MGDKASELQRYKISRLNGKQVVGDFGVFAGNKIGAAMTLVQVVSRLNQLHDELTELRSALNGVHKTKEPASE